MTSNNCRISDNINIDGDMMRLYNDDCLNVLPTLSGIDLILTDLPYGVSQNKWDSIIPLDVLWPLMWNALKDDGVIALNASQPFTSTLLLSQPEHFKVEYIWKKTIGSGQLNIKHQPLRMHESILVFYKKRGTYNPQLRSDKSYSINRNITSKQGYGEQRSHYAVNEGVRQPTTVLEVPNPRIRGGHPTEKPVELNEFFIKTYTNPGDTVLDFCMGSGSTGQAALTNDRRFVGVELDRTYYEKASDRLRARGA